MRCPKCQSTKIKVLDTRSREDVITRRRECVECYLRFNTNELLDLEDMIKLDVKKREGKIEPFSSAKLREGIKLACYQTKSEISEIDLEYLLNEIKRDIFLTCSDQKIVTSEQIGLRVIKLLLDNDKVGAAIRFASVFFEYRQPEIQMAISNVIRNIIDANLDLMNPKILEEDIKKEMVSVRTHVNSTK